MALARRTRASATPVTYVTAVAGVRLRDEGWAAVPAGWPVSAEEAGELAHTALITVSQEPAASEDAPEDGAPEDGAPEDGAPEVERDQPI